jgi:hypothetical protein
MGKIGSMENTAKRRLFTGWVLVFISTLVVVVALDAPLQAQQVPKVNACPLDYFGRIDLECDNYSKRYVSTALAEGFFMDSCPKSLNIAMTLCDPDSTEKDKKAWYRPALEFESKLLEYPTRGDCVANVGDLTVQNANFGKTIKRGQGQGFLMVDWGIADFDKVRVTGPRATGGWVHLVKVFKELPVVGVDPCLHSVWQNSTLVNAWPIPNKSGNYVLTIGRIASAGVSCSGPIGLISCSYRSRSTVIENLKVEVAVSAKNVIVKRITCLVGTKIFECDGPGF